MAVRSISTRKILSGGLRSKAKVGQAAAAIVALVLDDPEDDGPFGEAVYLSSVFIDGADAGLVVSSGYGHRGASIAMAVVDRKAVKSGSDISVNVLGRPRQPRWLRGMYFTILKISR